jgi:hypothetical protein
MRAGRPDLEAWRVAVARHRRLDGSAARDRRGRDDEQVEEELDPVLRHQKAWGRPGQIHLVVVDEAPRDVLGIAEIDRRPRRSRRAEGDAGELQARRRRLGALLDELEREGLHRRVVLILQDLEAVDDGADGIDHVVAHTRAQEGRKIEGVEVETSGHVGPRREENRRNAVP